MINKQELRVGNLLMHGDQIVTVEEIGDTGINMVWLHEMSHWNYDYGNLSPIPLTSEWLERLGFAKVQDGDMAYPEIWRLVYTRVNVPYSFDLQSRGDEEWRWFEGNSNVPIYGVHELQNLIHSLFGKELTIKQ